MLKLVCSFFKKPCLCVNITKRYKHVLYAKIQDINTCRWTVSCMVICSLFQSFFVSGLESLGLSLFLFEIPGPQKAGENVLLMGCVNFLPAVISLVKAIMYMLFVFGQRWNWFDLICNILYCLHYHRRYLLCKVQIFVFIFCNKMTYVIAFVRLCLWLFGSCFYYCFCSYFVLLLYIFFSSCFSERLATRMRFPKLNGKQYYSYLHYCLTLWQ